jgi:hypothetical protein
LNPLQSVAFGGLLLAFTTAYNVKMLVFGYQSIDMHCIVVRVKFDGGSSMSVLRNKQLFPKKMSKVYIFKKVSNFQKHFKSRHLKGQAIPLEKVPLFFYKVLLLNEIVNLT